MTRRSSDGNVAVVGAGVVGLTAALAIAEAGRDVSLIEARETAAWDPEAEADLRVFAMAPASIQLLDRLGAWKAVLTARHAPYRDMRVWDAAATGELHFSARDIGSDQLGVIVEQSVLLHALHQRIAGHSRISCHIPDRVIDVEYRPEQVVLELDSGRSVTASLLIAADGAGSPLREQAAISIAQQDYGQRGLVAYVDCEIDHGNTAWQRFLPEGPLAFLPSGSKRCSIVWSQSTSEAERRLELDEETFCAELERAFDARLGRLKLVSQRAAFPLQRLLANQFVKDRLLLIGDAAHVVHPLAGQGANLGLQDVSCLARLFRNMGEGESTAQWQRLLHSYARERRSEAAIAGRAFGAINALFSNDQPLLSLTRGPALGLLNRLAPIKSLLAGHAAGRR